MKSAIQFFSFFFIVITILTGCKNGKKDSGGNSETVAHTNYNITILLDLSDRISAIKNPDQAEKDIAAILRVVHAMKKGMDKKGVFAANDCIKVVFYPNHFNSTIQSIAKALDIDFAELEIDEKRKMHSALDSIYRNNLTQLYNIASSAGYFNGSDIFNYFRHRATDDCISDEPNTINVLVVVTDGYMYFANSIYQKGNRYSFIGPNAPHVSKFRKNPNWQSDFTNGDYGFLSAGVTLKQLHILALEFAPWGPYTDDYDIMKAYWSKWFDEMQVSKDNYKILKTDLPSLNEKLIDRFFARLNYY